jgi:hypothetical protein
MAQDPSEEEDEEEFDEGESDEGESAEKYLIGPEDYYDFFRPDSVEPGAAGVPNYPREEAYRRIKHLCDRLQKLINIVPTYLPVEGEPDRGPQFEVGATKPLLDAIFTEVNLPLPEWVALRRVLPKPDVTALETLARTVDGIWRRWSRAEQRFRSDYERQFEAIARGQKPTDEVVYPVRLITPDELTWLKQSLPVVQEAVAREEARTSLAAAARASRSGPGSRAVAPERDEARDKWIYENILYINKKLDQILIEFRTVAKQNNWRLIGSVNGLRDRAKAYAARHNLPPPPARQGK